MAKRTKKLIENKQIDDDTRINKYLSDAGVCSRREADKYIADGKITIDGVTAVMGSKVKAGQAVLLEGKPVSKDESLALIAFNKPRGIVCTTDKREKNNIIDFIQYNKRIYPSCEIVFASRGLPNLFTNLRSTPGCTTVFINLTPGMGGSFLSGYSKIPTLNQWVKS